MDDRLDEARQRGDGPRAPTFVGFFVVAGGLLGAAAGAIVTPWRALATAGFGLDSQALALIGPALRPVLLGGLVGVLAGAVGAHLLLDRFTPALRLRIHRGGGGRSTGLAALLLVLPAAALTPVLLAIPGGRDPGDLLLKAPALALGLGLLFALPLALVARARGRGRWRDRVAPDPPPRRRPDEAAPEVRGALMTVARTPDYLGDCVWVSGDYAVATTFDPPRLIAHGGPALVRAAQAQGLPVVVAPALAGALAGVPTGDLLPPTLAAQVRAMAPSAP